MLIFKFCQKIREHAILMEGFVSHINYERNDNHNNNTRSFKCIAPFFMDPEQKQISRGGNHPPSIPFFDS